MSRILNAWISLIVLGAGIAVPGAQAGDPAATPVTAQDVLSVRDFGALGDGTTDDTAAFRAALEAAAARPGTVVSVPIGNYLIASSLTIPAFTTLEGVWRSPTAWSARKGSTLLATYGKGDEDGPPFMALHANATVKGITVFHPDQDPGNPVPYPWTIGAAGGDNVAIIDVLLVNPYQGVDLGRAPAGRHYVRNLYGQPLRRGMFIDQIYDVGRVENVHFWPFWTWDQESGIREWLAENGEAFIIGRTDWQYMANTFCFGYRIGYRFVRTPHGTANGNFLGIGADATCTAVQVDDCAPYGLLITNGEFVSMLGDDPVAVIVTDANSGVVQFVNCAFWGPSRQIARIRGRGAVQFSTCNFRDWDWRNEGLPAIEAYSGDLIVKGCFFRRRAPQARIREGVKGAILTGNMFLGPEVIFNEAPRRTVISSNLGEEPLHEEEADAIVIGNARGDPGFRTEGEWFTAADVGEYGLFTHWAIAGDGRARARFEAPVPRSGRYEVFTWVSDDPARDHASDAPWTVAHADGDDTIRVDLRRDTQQWRSLGVYRFAEGKPAAVSTSNDADGNVIADAVKFRPVDE